LDWALALYTSYSAIIILVGHRSIVQWLILFLLHVGFLFVLLLLPPRGAPWEEWRKEAEWRTAMRRAGVFLRYMYPLIPILLFFEEGRFIVNAIFPDTPYWFEPYLYAADHKLFGDHPSLVFLPWLSRPFNELMHFFYFSYFVILIGGPLLGRLPSHGSSSDEPGFSQPGFESVMTSMILGFLCSYVWYPWFAARGPFENTELMARLPDFEGGS
jgi:hypothetical protein